MSSIEVSLICSDRACPDMTMLSRLPHTRLSRFAVRSRSLLGQAKLVEFVRSIVFVDAVPGVYTGWVTIQNERSAVRITVHGQSDGLNRSTCTIDSDTSPVAAVQTVQTVQVVEKPIHCPLCNRCNEIPTYLYERVNPIKD